MGKARRYGGFSLIEVLLAVGTLAIGMIFIGGTFLVGIHFSTISSERTIAVVVAKEAFSKVKLFGVHPSDANCVVDRLTPFEMLEHGFLPAQGDKRPIDPNEFAYPSARTLAEKQYFWSALCRRVAPAPGRSLQVTVFVSRKVGISTKYRNPADPLDLTIAVDYPMPVEVGVSKVAGNIFAIAIESGKEIFVNEGSTIVENSTGAIYRVIDQPADPTQVILDRPWDPGGTYPDPDSVWVVPPPIVGGRGPCIKVYQE